MINSFRALNPVNIIWLAILTFALRAGYIFHLPVKSGFAFTGLFDTLLIERSHQFTLNPFSNIMLASILVFVQALLLNYLVNHYNLLGKPTFLPALMYTTLSSLFTPFLILSPPLVCNFLVIWMLHKLFSFYKGTDVKSAAYDLGMIVAAGSVIYLPFVYLFLSIWIALMLYRPFNWREMMSGVIGYITVFFFLAVYYYLQDHIDQFYRIWVPLGTKFPESVTINYYNYLVLVPVIIVLVLCFLKLQQNFFKSYVQVRKSFQLLFIIFLLAGLSFFIKAAFHPEHFLLCAIPTAVFFGYYFLYAKIRWFYELLFLMLVVGIVYFHLTLFNF